tara:strand:+ start:30587 stop:30868 length:282 start_codon:yes stop_codon:yes gene_type:complete
VKVIQKNKSTTMKNYIKNSEQFIKLNENKDQPVFIDTQCDDIQSYCDSIKQCCAKAKRIKGGDMFPKGGGQTLETLCKQLKEVEAKINSMVAG